MACDADGGAFGTGAVDPLAGETVCVLGAEDGVCAASVPAPVCAKPVRVLTSISAMGKARYWLGLTDRTLPANAGDAGAEANVLVFNSSAFMQIPHPSCLQEQCQTAAWIAISWINIPEAADAQYRTALRLTLTDPLQLLFAKCMPKGKYTSTGAEYTSCPRGSVAEISASFCRLHGR